MRPPAIVVSGSPADEPLQVTALRSAVVVAQKTTQPMPTIHLSTATLVARPLDQLVPQALVITFTVIVDDILGEGVPEVPVRCTDSHLA
jgi:hypothetical protein